MTASPAVESAIVADIGNTRIALALWGPDGLRDVSRGDTHDDGWRARLAALAARRPRPGALVVSSVNPHCARALDEAAPALAGLTPLLIGRDIALPMPLAGVDAGTVGVDRVCAAAAAHERVRSACVAASLGTAITIDLVSADGQFLGGSILPGLEMSLRALHEFTAALPHVALAPPPHHPARNTQQAMLSGVIYGAVGALREIVERYASDLGHWPPLIATGGNAALLQPHADFIDAVVPDLCLIGAALALQRAATRAP